MRVELVTAFDLGRSFGVGDDAFVQEARSPDPDVEWVAIRNPLGNGSTLDLLATSPELLQKWREESVRQLRRAELETGWSEVLGISEAAFDAELETLVTYQPATICQVTVFAVGTAYVRVGIELTNPTLYLLDGLLSAWEYAAYTKPISDGIARAVEHHLRRSIVPGRTDFETLTRRPGASTRTSGAGYMESTLFTSFTRVIECPGDEDPLRVTQILKDFEMRKKPVEFEYHGKLYFSWETCVLVARGVDPMELELERHRECMRIAHVFSGSCAALLSLFETEIKVQVDSYFGADSRARGLADLNRLRTFALAVVTLTNFDRVTDTKEDRRYFAAYATEANIDRTQQLLTESVSVLFEVQAAEVQEERSGRELLLNAVVLALALITLISVSADAYNFVREQESIVGTRVERLEMLVLFLAALLVLSTVFLTRSRSRPLGMRRRKTRKRPTQKVP
ncbi:hypothetical protein [Terrabacter sp. Root181]|uniref:hypothetical protein n=1 Tax=Terrabacter sp. Root181 TaxID=1736484 RepID=UPI0006FEF704|nr:hypothetical protein [Terrabacter sp. Root181]KRB43025.1 hypothetical protein ASD90_21805 [Terrabacter sp. Root181]